MLLSVWHKRSTKILITMVLETHLLHKLLVPNQQDMFQITRTVKIVSLAFIQEQQKFQTMESMKTVTEVIPLLLRRH